MRIAIDGRTMTRNKSGVGMYAFRTVESLLRIDQQNDYHLFLVEENERLSAPNLTKVLIPGYDRMGRNRWWENVMLPRYLRQHEVDLFFSPAYALTMYPRLQRFIPALTPLRSRLVVTIHDVIGFVMPETFTWKMRLWLRVFAGNAARIAHHIITISQTTKNDFIHYTGCPSEKVSVIYNSIDDRFCPIDDVRERQRVQQKYNLPDTFILYVGTIEPRKNLPTLSQAYSLLPEHLRGRYPLVLAGGLGWKTEPILASIHRSHQRGEILLTGYVEDEDLPTLYNLASLFVYPSLYEGFGYPVLEAMACGIPVVCSNRASLPEVAGDAAILVNPYDARELARAMERVLLEEELRNDLIRKGFERAAGFSWKRSATQTLEVFHKAVNG
jgi:glycosyltransferase involved in cell wall biosynthesis